VTPNPGYCPPEAAGKRVRVVLAKDAETMRQPTYDNHWNPMSKPGWAADTSRWSRTGEPHDIAFFEVIK
jgi:hypothetical protein